jgi:hypothetical protein
MNVLQFILRNHAEVLELTAEHLWLVGASIALAVLVGIPLGIAITRWPVLSWGAQTSFRPSPAWLYSDFCCPRPGSARAPIASPYLRLRSTHFSRSFATLTPASEAWIRP